ncbi:MAG: class I SAM-dependent methyltransferase, partial [Acidimicrobiia bacterium]
DPPNADPAPAAGEVLVHSLAVLAPVIVPALECAGARRLVEVGVEGGGMTAVLREYVARVDGAVTGIDPFPSATARAAYAADGRLTLVEERSPGALARIEAADAYLFDGDHNHWTVLGELRAVAAAAGDGHPLVFVHDVGWPAGRRDQYYDPAALPAEAVHPYTYAQGVRMGSSATIDGGFRGEGAFAWAIEEGGPNNGVRTAVEDFVAETARYRWAFVPSVFGLAVVSTVDAPFAAALDDVLQGWVDNPVFGALERNRLELYDRVLLLQDLLAVSGDAGPRLRNENARLRAHVAELEARLATIRGEVEAMGFLKALRAVDAVERPARRMRPGATLRARLAEVGNTATVPSSTTADDGAP